jgi:hypothetical protein
MTDDMARGIAALRIPLTAQTYNSIKLDVTAATVEARLLNLQNERRAHSTGVLNARPISEEAINKAISQLDEALSAAASARSLGSSKGKGRATGPSSSVE